MTNKEWINTEWSMYGGLITPATASKILGLSRQHIARMTIKEIKSPWKKTFHSYAEIMQIADHREKNGVRRGRKKKTRKTPLSVEITPIQEKR